MGRMNDIEKKKTLFQILSRFRDVYLKLNLVLEWTKVSNEHLALKSILSAGNCAKNNLSSLIGGLNHNSNSLSSKKHEDALFKSVKDLLVSSQMNPTYFAPSIEALSPLKQGRDNLSEAERSCWISTLESILRLELAKNIINIPITCNVRVVSITDGKAKVLFLNLFEFELTLVPESVPAPALSSPSSSSSTPAIVPLSAWFILGVQVGSMKEIFKNSLTGIFQFKYNKQQIRDPFYLKNITDDCLKYIELFYYEKMFSQFAHFSNIYSKSICTFTKSSQSDSFKISPWFMEDSICFSFLTTSSSASNSSCCAFKVENCPISIIPSLSFDENEAQVIFESLFSIVYISKLETFLLELESKTFISTFDIKKREHFNIIEIILFENFKISLSINPFLKKFEFLFIDSLNVFLEFDNLEMELEMSLLKFDSEKFLEVSCEIKKTIFERLIAKNHSTELSIIKCPEISSKQKQKKMILTFVT